MDENSPAFRAAAAILQDQAEDLLLLEYVECVQRSGFPITKSQLMAAARDLRRRRDPAAGEMDRDFYGSWLLDHPEVRIYRDATTLIIKFFEDLTKIVRDCRIGASEYWSQDECSIRAGTVRQQVQVAVTESIRSQTSRGVDPSNPESTGLLVTANGACDTIPPWLIFKTFPASWPEEGEAVDDNDESIRFVQSATGFSNAEIALQWLHHFNMWSWKRSERAQQSGKTLEEWFGCDAWLRNPQTPHSEPHTATPTVRLPHEKIYRLLVIDSSLGHTSLDFFDYCRKFDIIVIVIPSDLPFPQSIGEDV
ncbi:hypothetical protein BBK36DRAFT_1145077 [Trichoderma citrinoviride]|uniref:DDE-1 domain-containing protein n=1 Tax=Trichoderma citrinoviride TaxID=58853 RepID=A0A2T4AZ86_9HYPO|nr:hypothetical protein BBK36DRAFT_1145077 [Trichoderma citrinoviride]PTB62291.1 hypothetical protein BBK36DRAFT_1145077 [Trichoderma citrinoviride]